MSLSLTEMIKATQLTKSGRLMDATRVIQQALGLGKRADAGAAPADAARAPERRAREAEGDVVSDVAFREIDTQPANEPAWRPRPAAPATTGETVEKMAAPAQALKEAAPEPVEAKEPATAPPADKPAKPQPASFASLSFRFGNASHAYRLYVPAGRSADALDAAPLPLVVLLHGCKQNAEDFALGTAMNALADDKKCLVLYPEQSSSANSLRCWNWFDAAHQARDAGEPKMIAALVAKVIKTHNADAKRVYIAGLSAGGAMAALVAALYPELFAAVGVHSGLPPGAATDVMSAFSAMKRGAKKTSDSGDASGGVDDAGDAIVMPTIVFHGSADKTVNPDNGEQIIDAALAALDSAGLKLKKVEQAEDSPGTSSGRRDTLRTIYSAADGVPYVEYWEVGSGPHAWSGGDAAGSYTDPHGPSASQAMLAFFLQHKR